MPKRPRILRSQRQIIGHFATVNPHAAGIDAGSEHHLVSVPEDRCQEPVRTFGTFTKDLNALAEWLRACGITTVAVEATGVYWVPLYEILEERGLNPKLIDARSVGRRNKKTDVLDCQWIRQLHMYGLLDGAFRPSASMLMVRALTRQRRMLIGYGADHVRHIQKALELMNVKLHLVVSDTVGVTGLRIIRAIVGGEREPSELAALREAGCGASEQTFVDALMGNYREEHLFALKQAVELFEVYQKKIAECDEQLATVLAGMEKRRQIANGNPLKQARGRRKNQPHFAAQTLLHEVAGIDLTAIHGFAASTVLTIISETGTDMSPWPSGKHFAAWLALSPNNRITGGKPIRKNNRLIRPNRAAQAFRLAAQTLERATGALGSFFRRIKSRHGRQVAIKATAHKLALIVYAMLKHQTEYREIDPADYEQRYRNTLLNSLTKKAAALGFSLTPLQEGH
ncbi:MAG TPA: IS110 family transposase [Thermoanaerobaculia bacterium]|nr:IS110 family transposase [Thermoanaerobaculia bacterium]